MIQGIEGYNQTVTQSRKFGPGTRRVEFLPNNLAVIWEVGKEQNARQSQVATTSSSYILDALNSPKGVSERIVINRETSGFLAISEAEGTMDGSGTVVNRIQLTGTCHEVTSKPRF
jgi:hypothetical protein